MPYPATEWPFSSRGGLNIPMPILPDTAAIMPPPTPDFEGTPTSAAYAPLTLYMPPIVIIASRFLDNVFLSILPYDGSPLQPFAKNAPSFAKSQAVTSIEHCLK